jgi:hypothetical protein
MKTEEQKNKTFFGWLMHNGIITLVGLIINSFIMFGTFINFGELVENNHPIVVGVVCVFVCLVPTLIVLFAIKNGGEYYRRNDK